jgi:hypothetical protein
LRPFSIRKFAGTSANPDGSGAEWRNMMMIDGSYLAVLLGATTLLCWMGAGVAAVLETDHELRSGQMKGMPEQISLGLSVAGVLSAVAMAVVIAWL